MIQKVALLISYAKFALAAGGTYNYKTNNGADWPDVNAACGLKNQSPINLETKGEYPVFAETDDNFNKMYTNQKGSVEVKWVGDTSKITLKTDTTNSFNSDIASKQFKANTLFNGAQFHFHAGSEHTVDGVRQDLEMHTVHLAQETLSNFGYAAMGIMFSVNDYTPGVSDDTVAIIDKFFDSMEWEKNDPKVAEVPYGDLMLAVDTDNRWVYKGSVTTPPCGQSVFWNVVTTIYPIKQKHLDLFKKQLGRGENDLAKTGNWRLIQEVDDHAVIMIKSKQAEEGNMAMMWAWILLAVVIVLLIIQVICYMKYQKDLNKAVEDVKEDKPADKMTETSQKA